MPPEANHDIIIVGASITGAASAIALAKEGYRILVVDQAVFPRHKACGEVIMPQGVQIVADVGLLPPILAAGGHKVPGMRYCNRHGVVAQSDFPAGPGGISFGLVMPRFQLDHLLLQQARSFANVTVREGFKVAEVIQEGPKVCGIIGHAVDSPGQLERFSAPLTIAADGRNSLFHAACGFTKTFLKRKRFGITGHLQGLQDVSPYVEVCPHEDGEVYIAPCGQTTLVVLLLEERAMKNFKGDLTGRYLASLQETPGFGARTLHSEVVPPITAVGPLGFTLESCFRPGLLLIGDSAGFLDPITGEGMTLALKGVQAAVPLIKKAFASGDFGEAMGQQYAADRVQLVNDVFCFTRFVLNFSRYKLLSDRAIRRLSHDQPLFQKFMGIVSGSRKYQDISLREKVSLLMG